MANVHMREVYTFTFHENKGVIYCNVSFANASAYLHLMGDILWVVSNTKTAYFIHQHIALFNGFTNANMLQVHLFKFLRFP